MRERELSLPCVQCQLNVTAVGERWLFWWSNEHVCMFAAYWRRLDWNENLIFDIEMINSRFNLRACDSSRGSLDCFQFLLLSALCCCLALDHVNIFIFFYWHLIRFTASVSGSFMFYAQLMLMILEESAFDKATRELFFAIDNCRSTLSLQAGRNRNLRANK